MKKTNFTYLLIILTATLFMSCSQNDDLSEVFLKHSKKLTAIVADGNGTLPITWAPKEQQLLLNEENYILSFTGTESGDKISGEFTFKLVNATHLMRGTWSANSDTRSIYFENIKQNGSDNDEVSKKIKDVLNNVYSYQGDSNTLRLYSKKDKQPGASYYMLFKRGPKKDDEK